MIQTVRVKTNNEQVAKVYRLEGITKDQAQILAEKLFCENINQTYTINKRITNGAVEIAYKLGVMNPEVASIIKAAKDLGIKIIACDSSREYIDKMPTFNPLIEYIVNNLPKTLLIRKRVGETKIIPIRKMIDDKLLELSKDKLFLNLEEMKVIQKYFLQLRRDPTDCELETIAQTWSEHCAHKTFKAKLIVEGKEKRPLIERIKRQALKHKKHIVSAFIDNSGVMDFYDGWAINGKVETHNSPSAIEPYGGAATGSGGVFRDILGTGLGAKTIASTDIFCFASPDMDSKKLPPGCLPPKYLLKRVVEGVRDYGNRMGIPTNNGSVHFHDDFRGKPTVIVGAYGIIPKNKAKKGKPRVGDLAVVVGGRTGRDGIHGATFASGEMTDKTINVNAQAVQIGNAIEEKRTFDAILEARDQGLIRAIQDCGAGGFSSAIGEMGEKIGVSVWLERAPLKYQGLTPWEIWLSESQERMIVVTPKRNLKKFIQVCKKYNVEASVLAKFDGSKKLKVHFKNKLVCSLDMKFLHHGLPQRVMQTKTSSNVILSPKDEESRSFANAQDDDMRLPKTEKAWTRLIKKTLSNGDVCSKEPIVRLYDHSVQGTNVLPPFNGEKLDSPNDAVVIRPLLDKKYAMVISHGLNPPLNDSDPYWGSIWAAAEAISNYVAVGGNYKNASLINNYIWPFPDEESLWSLDRSVDAVCDFMKALKIPVISGKDSLSSTYRGKNGMVIKIPPVLCISVFGKIPDVSKTASSDFKKVESTIVLVGKLDFNNPPHVDLKILPKVLDSIYKGIQKEKILSCHDVSEGGIITSVFEMCVGGNIGARININNNYPTTFLLNETAGCFIVEVENEKVAKKVFNHIPFKVIGKTAKEKTIAVFNKKKKVFKAELGLLKKAWQAPMRKIFA